MEVTNIEIELKHDDNEVMGLASITLDNLFVIKGLQIVKEEEDVHVLFPGKKNSFLKSSIQPRLNDFQRYLQTVVIDRYREEIDSSQFESSKSLA